MDALFPIILLLGTSSSLSAQAPLIPRNAAAKIDPLVFDVPGGDWGPQDRTADHATVANNARGDVAVAYHTSRTDVVSHPPLKQVEVAIFLYDSTQDEWLL